MFGFDDVLATGMKIIDKLIPDAGEKAAMQLKLMEAQQAGVFKDIDADLEQQRIAAADRASAREREDKTGDSWTPRVLAAIIVSGYLLVQWFLLHNTIPAEMREIVLRSMGTLDMALGLVLGYYFGSSAGSKKKDDTITQLSGGGK